MSKSVRLRHNRILKLIERDGGQKCHYCGVSLIWGEGNYMADNSLCIDHVQPLAHKGANSLDNLVLACRKCNAKKYTKHYHEFRMTIETDRIIYFMMGAADE